jgi:lipoprotein-anchoring transpeptidase ErfK/SrfK
MRKTLKRHSYLLSTALCLALTLTFLSAATSFAIPVSTWTGVTTSAANVRTGPTTSAARVATYGAGTRVTVYASVRGQIVWGGISTWYRISSLSSAPRYIYGGLIAHASSGGGSTSSAPSGQGKVIVVNRADNVQRLYAYENGKLVFTTPVTTGSINLQTYLGTWHIYRKLQNVWFHSPWPQGSPYYYAPVFVHYAMDYDGALFLHDATWRGVFGPGTDRRHYDPKLGWTDGSHGCIEMSLSSAQWLYNWAGIGTTVKVID